MAGSGHVRWHKFNNGEDLAEALARTIAHKLGASIDSRGRATLAVSGGTTPAALFAKLSETNLDWVNVKITLVDERFVPATSPRSNEGLVRRVLLKARAAQATFVPLYHGGQDEEDAAMSASLGIEAMPWPLDVIVLGMGADGHTASFFPDAVELETLLDPANTALVSAVHAKSAGEPRLTMTLPPIASARFVALHIEGAEKLATVEKALAQGTTLPIRRVIGAMAKPVEIFWAP